MSCTGWRFGISSVVWPSIRDRRERPRAGTDCVSRKCSLPDGTLRRYTICRVRHQPHPRLRIYDDSKMVGSMIVPDFDAGKAYVDRWINGRTVARRR